LKTEMTKKKKFNLQKLVSFLPFILLGVVFLVFTILFPPFARFRNIMGILSVSTVFLLVASGETFPILMGSIDLSIGMMLCSSAIVGAYFFPYGGPWMILIVLAMGVVSGLVNGLLIVSLRLPSFIVTLAMMYIFKGLATSMTDGYNINIRNRNFTWLASGKLIPEVPNIILFGFIVFFVFVIISKKTKIGLYIRAIGSNEESMKRMGINVNKYRVIAFIFSGLLNGFGCVLLCAYLGMAPAQLGDKYLFNTLIAVVVGGTSIAGGVGGLMRTFVGVFLIGMFDNGMNLVGVGSNVQNIVKGLLLIAAISMVVFSVKRGKISLTK